MFFENWFLGRFSWFFVRELKLWKLIEIFNARSSASNDIVVFSDNDLHSKIISEDWKSDSLKHGKMIIRMANLKKSGVLRSYSWLTIEQNASGTFFCMRRASFFTCSACGLLEAFVCVSARVCRHARLLSVLVRLPACACIVCICRHEHYFESVFACAHWRARSARFRTRQCLLALTVREMSGFRTSNWDALC